jgi:hypothetical protein
MPLLITFIGFAIAVPALLVAFVAAHLWLAATIVLRLGTGQYVRAALWFYILGTLVTFDIGLASAAPARASTVWATGQAPEQAAPAPACDLFIELVGQSLHVMVRRARSR